MTGTIHTYKFALYEFSAIQQYEGLLIGRTGESFAKEGMSDLNLDKSLGE
jgi:hypothetical protein